MKSATAMDVSVADDVDAWEKKNEEREEEKEDTAKSGFIERRDDKKGRTKGGLSIYIITYI